MIEILTMDGKIQSRYVVGADRYDETWHDMHRPLTATLQDNPKARVRPLVPGAPFLEYGATLPLWAEHPEYELHQFLCAYDRAGSARPIYVAWLIPGAPMHAIDFLASGAAMIAALTFGGTDGTHLLPEIAAAAPESMLIGGYTPDAMLQGPNLAQVAQYVSESLPCLALQLLGEA